MGIGPKRHFPGLPHLLAASHTVPKSKAAADIGGYLNLTLTRPLMHIIADRNSREAQLAS